MAAPAILQWLQEDGLYQIFSKDVRPGLFSGFLTVSGFLYSAHTFIVIHMKKELYDCEGYRRRIAAARELNPNHSYYGTLRRLSKFLMLTVVCSLATSLFQVTLGLFHYNWTAIVCMGVAFLTFTLLLASVYFMAQNLKSWFNELEDSEREKRVDVTTPKIDSQ